MSGSCAVAQKGSRVQFRTGSLADATPTIWMSRPQHRIDRPRTRRLNAQRIRRIVFGARRVALLISRPSPHPVPLVTTSATEGRHIERHGSSTSSTVLAADHSIPEPLPPANDTRSTVPDFPVYKYGTASRLVRRKIRDREFDQWGQGLGADNDRSHPYYANRRTHSCSIARVTSDTISPRRVRTTVQRCSSLERS